MRAIVMVVVAVLLLSGAVLMNGMRAERDSARHTLAVYNSSDFEQQMMLDIHFGVCQPAGAAELDCNGVLDGKLARYRCTFERCEWVVKP